LLKRGYCAADMWQRLACVVLLAPFSSSAPFPLPSTLKPSRVFYLKMPLTLPYSLSCQPGGGPCKYQSRLDQQKEKALVAAYSNAGNPKEASRGGKKGRDIGRKISSYKKADPYTWKPIEPPQPSINYIQTSDVEEKPWKRKKYVTTTSKSSRQKLRKEDWMKKAAAKEDKVLRPRVTFMSNARPSILKWRELKVKKTPIIKAKPLKLDYNSRLKKKYGSSGVPVHLGYSRNFVEDSPVRYRGPGSATTWLPSPAYVNGLPQTLLHWQYPVKVARLNTNLV